MEIEAGDTVQLKTGGPEMVVEVITIYDQAKCTWFDAEGKHHSQAFAKVALKKV